MLKSVYALKDPDEDILGEIPAFVGGETLAGEVRADRRPKLQEELFEALFYADSPLKLHDQLEDRIVLSRTWSYGKRITPLGSVARLAMGLRHPRACTSTGRYSRMMGMGI